MSQAMIRRSFRLTKDQDNFMAWLAAKNNINVAELVRDMVEQRMADEIAKMQKATKAKHG